ncbi:MAG: type II secretion system F family protein [Candidatus Taylorbacteria bacterium]
MLFNYEAIESASGTKRNGSIDAVNVDIAISSLQRRNLVLVSIKEAEESQSLFGKEITWFDRVSTKDIVILSRQLSTLFDAQVSALRIFRLLSTETENRKLASILRTVSDDIQSGNSISSALSKHSKVFSPFYVSMVKAGEESGKLNEVFEYLADYLDRTYELVSKVRGALVYPAFVFVTFIVVMILMFTMVIPKISGIILDSGGSIPIYTQIILGISNFLVNYGFVLLGILLVAGFFLVRFVRTSTGKAAFDNFKLNIPYVSGLYKKLYLSRFSDNMNTMLVAGIPIVRALELTSTVIDNRIYQDIIMHAAEGVRGGKTLSESISNDPREMPGIIVQMVKVGEESGEVGFILKTVAKFYVREVETAVESLVSVIEPAMIVFLGGGVAVLLASVLIPIYSIANSQ